MQGMNEFQRLEADFKNQMKYSDVLGFFFFVPYLIVTLFTLATLYSKRKLQDSRRKQHLKRVFLLLSGTLLMRTVDFGASLLLGSSYPHHIKTFIHLLPSLLLVSLFSYICYVFFDMYSFMKYEEEVRRRKRKKARNMYILMNVGAYILLIVVLSLVYWFTGDGLNEKEIQTYFYTRAVVTGCWFYNFVTITTVGLKLYKKMQSVARIRRIELDLSKLKKILILITVVTALKTLIQGAKVIFEYYYSERNMTIERLALRYVPSFQISGIEINPFIMFLILFPPLFLEMLPLIFIVRILAPPKSKRRASIQDKKLVQRFISNIGSTKPTPRKESSEFDLENTLD
eukprot:TRINITY_DN4130_c0_g5_i1.p1 TRINITY_DN4130_c0_g5~~TRINITY_DN4130_c0_g5_i1.p1  ORF type:complete len:343 (-),score=51.05 TRINITY_DN4130_c0_g5_i1:72-1100(-)